MARLLVVAAMVEVVVVVTVVVLALTFVWLSASWTTGSVERESVCPVVLIPPCGSFFCRFPSLFFPGTT